MRLSGRLPSQLAASTFAQRVASFGAVVDLTSSSPAACGLEADPGEVGAALALGAHAPYAPSALGSARAREAVAGLCAARAPIEPKDVVITASTSEAYACLFKLLGDPGAKVAVPEPSYPLLSHLAELEGLRPARYCLAYHGHWEIDLESLRRAAEQAVVVLVVSPNNPTGSVPSDAEWAQVREVCRAAGAALVVDEVFAPYTFDVSPLTHPAGPAPEEGPLTFVLDGLSKRCGMPQHKLAWMTLHGPRAEVGEARAGLEWILDLGLSVATPVQEALPRLLSLGEAVQRRIAERVRSNRSTLTRGLAEAPGATVLSARGGWSSVVRVPRVVTDEELVLALAERHGVLVQPGFLYDFAAEGHLVVSLLAPPEQFARGVTALASGLREVCGA